MTAGVVLTGGASRRMGADKARVVVDGVAMAVRVADALADAGCHPVWCQGGDAAALGELGLRVMPDTHPGEGPLWAIADALAGTPGVVVAACDLPWLTGAAVEALLDAAGETPGHPAALTVGGIPQLVSWWPDAVAGDLAALIMHGVRSYRAALARLHATLVASPAAPLRNVNSPQDLQG